MSRKKDNKFVAQRATDALNAAYTAGWADKELAMAQLVSNQAHERLQHTINLMNEVVIIPAKKDLN